MDKPLVSVVMVVCNVDRFLAASIESILTQTFREFDFIIVDFGSTDSSKSIVSTYAAKDSRVKFHEIPHCFLAEAREAACSLARGRYIAIMDADDESVPERLMWQFAFMEKYPQVGILGGATQWIDESDRALHVDFWPAQDDEIRAALADHYPFCHPTLLMRRDTFLHAGGYRPVFAQAEDYDLALRMSEHCQCANLERVVLRHRLHPGQLSYQAGRQQTLCKLIAQASSLARKSGNPDPICSVREITPAVLARLGVAPSRLQHHFARDRYGWIRNLYRAGQYPLALKEALEVLRLDLGHVDRWVVADLRFLAARLYWRQRSFLRSIFTGARAFISRPIMLGRPLKPLLRRLWTGNHQEVRL